MSMSESENEDKMGTSESSFKSNNSAKISPVTTEDEDEAQNMEENPEQNVIIIREGDIESRQKVTLPCNTTVKRIKMVLAEMLNLQNRNIKLYKNGRKLHNRDIIAGFPKYKVKQPEDSISQFNGPLGAEEIVLVEIGIDDSESESENERELDDTSSVGVSVLPIIDNSDGSRIIKEVAVMKALDSRPFLRGYKNKRTGVIYYHATTQTEPKNAKLFSSRVPAVRLNTRETQTLLPLIEEGVNTLAEKCTQATQREVFIPAVTDKVVTAKPYQSFDEKNKRMTPEAAARILQKALKVFIKKKRLLESYRAQEEERTIKQQFKGDSLAEFHKQQLALVTKDSFPSTRAHFYDLYTKMGEWKNEKVKSLKQEKSGFAYKVAIADLQKKETEGLQEIEEQRIRARTENLNRQDIMFLEETASSRIREYPNGNITIIDDLNIQRARKFKEHFASYTRKDVTKSERIEILSCMKSFLAEFEEVDLTEDLIELINREIDMMTMGIDDKHLAILRKRFESHFINVAKNPAFNPQAKYYRSSSQDVKKYAKYKCVYCGKVMYPSTMFIHLRMSRFRACASCAYMHTTATATVNLAPYTRILTSLRAAEQEKCCRSAIPFLLQPMGVYFLVNVLWNGKSVISGSSYLPSLKVTRWLPYEEWSMWNMILLTELEAHEHETLENPLQYYSKEFILNVMNRNILGRMHFEMVADIDAKFREREPKGSPPKDYLLYTKKHAEANLPRNIIHPCLVPSQTTYNTKVLAKKEAGN